MSLFASIAQQLARRAAIRVEANSVVLNEKFKQTGRLILVIGASYSAASLFTHYFFTYSIATGPSMYPTMPNYDHTVWIDLRKRYGKNMKLGDCVHFQNPVFYNSWAGKRIIGMPGDFVIRDPIMAASVGGAPVPGVTDWRSDEEIARGIELKERTEPELIEVPEGHVWVAGDNLSCSRDSRFYGPVPMALINGKEMGISTGLFDHTKLEPPMRRIPKEEEEAYLKGYAAGLEPATEVP